MSKLDNDANIEWKKCKKKAESSLNHSILETKNEDVYKKIISDASSCGPAALQVKPPTNLNKIRKKIKEVFDDEDDDDEETYQKDKSLEFLEQKQALVIEKINQDNLLKHKMAENIILLAEINLLFKQNGLKKIGKRQLSKLLANINPKKNIKEEVLKLALKNNVKIKENITKKDALQALRGVEHFEAKKTVEKQVLPKTNKELAKIIMKKTGRKKASIKMKPPIKMQLNDMQRE